MIAPRGFSGTDQPKASIYDACIRCGLCLPSCPTYLETMTETSGPRGRISLIKSVAQGQLDLLSAGFVHQMHECLDCRACEAVCPSGVAYGQLARNRPGADPARARCRPRARVPAWRSAVMRALFGRPNLMRAAARILRFAQQARLLWIAGLVGLGAAAKLAPPISPSFFFRGRSALRRAAARKASRCCTPAASCRSPSRSVHDATLRMLCRGRTLGRPFPAEQGCCGAIAVHAGDRDFARELAKRNIAAFERAAPTSTSSMRRAAAARCVSTASCLPATRSGRSEPNVFRLACATSPKSSMLSTSARRSRSVDATATYQQPCHLVHAQRVARAPRRLLSKIPGLRLVEMDESELCCGSAGIYNLTQPEMASRLAAT